MGLVAPTTTALELPPVRMPPLTLHRALTLLALGITGLPPGSRRHQLRWRDLPWSGTREVVRKGWRLLGLHAI